MRGNQLLILIAFARAMVMPCLARADATCPPTLSVQQKASVPNADWTVTYSGYDTAIAGVTIFEGPPASQASLLPDSERTNTDRVFQTWKLPKNESGYWLQCDYANTTAQVYRRLPADIARCDVTLERNVRFGGEGRRVVKSVRCK